MNTVRRARSRDVFGLALLDVVSCGFGAIVLLILISRTGLVPTPSPAVDSGALLTRTFALEQEQQQLDDLLERERLKLAESQGNNADARLALQRLAATEQSRLADADALSASTDVLKQRGEDLERTIQLTRNDTDAQDEEVGGIPVDGDYVIFVIDTSGSMRQIWSWVVREMDSLLTIHPQVKGFQIMNDNGIYMYPGQRGGWIKDTRGNRLQAFAKLKAWGANSNSNPMQGITEALRTYGAQMKRGDKVSIYVLGDDYTGPSYERDVTIAGQLNGAPGERLARIHALAFFVARTAPKFATLMREMAYRNDGTFMALTR
ncbi:MAG: hypothetical protein AAGA68_10285 [Pseudomonadota bacterium]